MNKYFGRLYCTITVIRNISYLQKMDTKKKMPPLSDFERGMLLKLVREYKHVIENKRTDSACMKQKNKTWDEISVKFCSAGNATKRSGRQLKKCWNNIKFKSRHRKMLERKARATGVSLSRKSDRHRKMLERKDRATGGGPSRKDGDDDEDEDLLQEEKSGEHLNVKLDSEFDCDTFRDEDDCQMDGVYDGIKEVEAQNSETDKVTNREDCRPMIGNGSIPQMKKHEMEIENAYVEMRKELDAKHIKEYHELKVQHENEFHAARMQHTEEIHRLSIKHMEELHLIIMKKLDDKSS